MPITERHCGTGKLRSGSAGIVSSVRYTVTIVAPEDGKHQYRRVEATLDLLASMASQLELGERLTLTMEDGRHVDLIMCGRLDNRVDVLALSGPRRDNH